MRLHLLHLLLAVALCGAVAQAAEPQAEPRRFDSALALIVYERPPEGYMLCLGQTPSPDWRGVPLPAHDNWSVMPKRQDQCDLAAVLRECQAQGVPEICLTDAALTPAQLALLAGCPGLKRLSLATQVLCAESLRPLAALENLEHLSLGCQGLLEGALAPLGGLTRLKSLRLHVTKQDALPNAALPAALGKLPALRELDLHAYVLLNNLDCLAGMENLERLGVTAQKLDDAALRGIGRLTRLRRLEVQGSGLTGACLAHLAELRKLEVLLLPQTRVSEAELAVLKDAPLTRLEVQRYRGRDPLTGLETELRIPSFTRLPLFDPAALKVDEQELQKARAIAARLDSDDFDERERASQDLNKASVPALSKLLAEARASGAALERIERLELALTKQNLSPRDKIAREAREAFETALRDERAAPPPSHPFLAERLKRHITFEFVDTPLNECLTCIEELCGVPLILDPSRGDAGPFITLRVTDMAADLGLEWMLKLANLDMVITGQAVITTSKAQADKVRAQALKLRPHEVELPVAPGETPWTAQETAALAALLPRWRMAREMHADGLECLAVPDLSVEVKRAGVLLVCCKPWRLDALNVALRAFSQPRVLAQPPAWVREIESKLDKRIEQAIETATLAVNLEIVKRSFGLPLVLDPRCIVDGGFKTAAPAAQAGMSAREYLKTAAQGAKMALLCRNGCLFMTPSERAAPEKWPYIFDLRLAEKAGVARAELQNGLLALLKDAGATAEFGTFVRGRWFVEADPWTMARIVAVLEGAAKTGKLLETPPAPWFFSTLGKGK